MSMCVRVRRSIPRLVPSEDDAQDRVRGRGL